MSDVKINLKSYIAFRKALPSFALKLEKTIAKKAPAEIVKNIHRRKTGIFPVEDLPMNKTSTQLRKGHGRQLVDKGILTTIGKWSIAKAIKGYLVRPPAGRADIVGYLNERTENRSAYKILEIPEGFFPDWARKIVVTAFKKFIVKFA